LRDGDDRGVRKRRRPLGPSGLGAEADDRKLPSYLETATPSNVGYYERCGYEVVGEIAMPSGPVMWRMERPAGG